MATPYPRPFLFIMGNHRQRLWIVNNHQIVCEMIADTIFVNDLFVDLFFSLAEIDLPALQRIVHLLGNTKIIRRSLDRAPAGLDPDIVHQERQR